MNVLGEKKIKKVKVYKLYRESFIKMRALYKVSNPILTRLN